MFPVNPSFTARAVRGGRPAPSPRSGFRARPNFRPAPEHLQMLKERVSATPRRNTPSFSGLPLPKTPGVADGFGRGGAGAAPMVRTPSTGFAITPPPTGDRMAVPTPKMQAAPPMGRAPDGTPLIPAELKFLHPGQDRLDPEFRKALEGVSDDMGRDLDITSGYRGPNHPVEAKKPGGPGMHSTGQAADISMSGMDETTRQDLIRRLYGAGALRFGTYTNSPDMLHVDMKDQHDTGAPHFMFDRTAAKMGKAPDYFRSVATTLREPTRSQDASSGDSPSDPAAAPRTPPAQGLFGGFDGQKFRKNLIEFFKEQAQCGVAPPRRATTPSPQHQFRTAPTVPWVHPIGRR